MNISDFCERFHISERKARRIYAALSIEAPAAELPLAVTIHRTLARGQPLTAVQLIALLEDPSLLGELGSYAGRAEAEIEALGTIEPAPKAVAAHISDAARNYPGSVAVLLDWLRATVPDRPVSHAYLAVRLLLGLSANIRHYDVPRIPRALLMCRRRPEFAGYWSVKNGKTIYRLPKVDAFDL